MILDKNPLKIDPMQIHDIQNFEINKRRKNGLWIKITVANNGGSVAFVELNLKIHNILYATEPIIYFLGE